MTRTVYKARLHRVNEGLHQAAEAEFDATGVRLLEDGGIQFDTPTGGKIFGASSWGSFEFVRVART